MDAGEVEDLAELAVSMGWFDQAHFSRDFSAVVGLPPSAYLHRSRTAADMAAAVDQTTGSDGERPAVSGGPA
jgi:AraC-like DNA-binding protein